MSSIVGAITGSGGGGFDAARASLVTPATAQQAKDLYGNVQTGLSQQQSFLQALQAQNGIGNQSSVFNQLQGVANGQGPNPAQAMLANATGQNVSNQAALMAGQRGAGANAGMMARQAAMAGSNAQQQAAGQGAALQAQQSLGALNQLGGIAGQQVAQQGNAAQAYSQTAGAAHGNVMNAINGLNSANVQNVSQANNANAHVQGEVAKQQGQMLGNMTGAIGAGLATAYGGPAGAAIASTFMKAEGGEIQSQGPRSNVGKHLHGIKFAQGGQVPALVSPGEVYLDPNDVEKVKEGADPIKAGEKIPGKAKVSGAKNSYANDTVPKALEEGGIVLPRSVTQSKHPQWAAHKFVAAILKKQALKGE